MPPASSQQGPLTRTVCRCAFPVALLSPLRLATHTFPWNTDKGSGLDRWGTGQGSRAQSQGQDLGLCWRCVPWAIHMPRPR